MPSKAPAQVYMGGDDPAIVAKRQAYEQALERLSKSLDARQQRMFDPAMLNVAAAFLGPSKTGSFWESLGSAAQGYSRGQEQLIKEEQDIARAQMEAASAGLDIERQKQSDAQLAQYLGGRGQPATLQTAAAEGLPSAAGPLSQQQGVQIMPTPQRMTGQKFIELNRGTMPPRELLKEAEKIDRENMKITESGAFDIATGRFYPAPKGDLVERAIYGYGPKGETQTVKVPSQIAYRLDELAAARDPAYYALVEQIKSGPPRPGMPTGEGLPAASESAARAKAEETRVVGREAAALKTEESLPAKTEAAQRAFSAAVDTERLVKKNPTAFGRLKQSGLMPGILNLVSQGVQTPGGSINIKQLDEFVVQTTGKEGDLVDRKLAARNMAELVLAFRRQYFSGYGGGAISDMEQSIVNQLASAPEDDPKTILSIMNLIKLRSQFDIDENRNWLKFKRENKKANYNDFAESEEYLERQDRYNRKIGKMFGTEPAVPSEQKTPSGSKQGFTPEQINAARDRLRKLKGE